MTTPPEPDSRCVGQPPLCDNCQVELVADPTGPWCRNCRRAWAGAPLHAPCPHPAVATGNTPRTRGLRLCRAHARLLVDRGGSGAVTLDQLPS
jgi:hypothetical protein